MTASGSNSGPVFPPSVTMPMDPGLLQRVIEAVREQRASAPRTEAAVAAPAPEPVAPAVETLTVADAIPLAEPLPAAAITPAPAPAISPAVAAALAAAAAPAPASVTLSAISAAVAAATARMPAPSIATPSKGTPPPPLPVPSHMAQTIKLDLSMFPEPSIVVEPTALRAEPDSSAPSVIVSDDAPAKLVATGPLKPASPVQLVDVIDIPPRDWRPMALVAVGAFLLLSMGAAFIFTSGSGKGSVVPAEPAAAEERPMNFDKEELVMPEVDLSDEAPVKAAAPVRPVKKAAPVVAKTAAPAAKAEVTTVPAKSAPVKTATAAPAPVKTAAAAPAPVKSATPAPAKATTASAAPAKTAPVAAPPAAAAKSAPVKTAPAKPAARAKGPTAVNCPDNSVSKALSASAAASTPAQSAPVDILGGRE